MALHDDDDVELTPERKAELERQLDALLAGGLADDTAWLAYVASRISADREPTTWHPVDLRAALEEARSGVESPGILSRSDGRHLVYEGRTHSLAGEPESGKTWLALMAVSQVISDGRKALWIDYEDTAAGVLGRLDALAIPESTIVGGLFTYIRPEEPLAERNGRGTPALFDFEEVLRTRWDFVVIDGVTEALVVEGFDPNSNADVAAWQRRIVKRFSKEGCAVLLLDHTAKAPPGGGDEWKPSRFAIGAQHKLAGLTGAGFRLDIVKPFRRAVGTEPAEGVARVVVTKDRPGHVRGVSLDGLVATMRFTAWPDGKVTLVLEEPAAIDEAPLDRTLVRAILDYLATYDGSTGRAINEGLRGRADAIRDALRRMAEMGLIEIKKVGAAHYHHLTDAGRAWVDLPPEGEDEQ